MSKNIEEYKPDGRFLGLFLSKSGDGKSTAAASFPEPYFEMDPDLRFGGISNSYKQGLILNKKISYQSFSPRGGWDPIGKCLEQFNIQKVQAGNNVSKFPYNTIGLGSLGSLERIILNFAKEKLDTRVIVGGIRLGSPGDQKIANSAVHQVIDYLQDMPCNVICTAHLVDRWGKPKSETKTEEKENAYKPNEIIGERLNLNDGLAESVVSRFNEVFRFDRETINGKIKYTVEFAGDLAKNSYGLPPGNFDWTGKDFYSWFTRLVDKCKETKDFKKLSEVK